MPDRRAPSKSAREVASRSERRSSRTYHVVCIPTVMGRPKQHGVRGLHIYTEHAVPRTLAHAARCVEPAGADRVHATIPEADARCPAADT
jgi:hypothetical protein